MQQAFTNQKRRMANRKQYTEQAKLQFLKDFRASKLTAREFCKRQGIVTSTFSSWRRAQALSRKAKESAIQRDAPDAQQLDFIPVALIEPKPRVPVRRATTFNNPSGLTAIEIVLPSGSMIRVDVNCPPSLVTAAFAAIGGH